jgi:hypothetical protein
MNAPSRRARPAKALLLPTILGFATYYLLLAIERTLPPAADQPLVLRWLRVLAEHPWRSPLALALVWASLLPLPRGSAPLPAAGEARGPAPGVGSPPECD